MPHPHRYRATLVWTGAARDGTRGYRDYSRDYRIDVAGKPPLTGSADSSFLGDGARHNPEDLLVAALSACHLLWYLHLCADNGLVVTAYEDRAEGMMVTEPGAGRFTDVVLRPCVTIEEGGDAALAIALHDRAHEECFIANSVNFPVRCEPSVNESRP